MLEVTKFGNYFSKKSLIFYHFLLEEVKAAKVVIAIFLVWRLLICLPLLIAPSFIPTQQDSKQYTLWAYTSPYSPVNSPLLYPLANFDGVHYLTVAGNSGYMVSSDGRFFPFYPLLLEIAGFLFGRGAIFGGNQFFGAFVISQLITLFACILFFKLLTLSYSKKIAYNSVLLLLAFPSSFFLGSIYSEGNFLLLTFGVFYALSRKCFTWAIVLAALLCVTRVVGILIIPFVAFFYLKEEVYQLLLHKKVAGKILRKKLLHLAWIPSGLILFALYSWYYWSDPFFFIHAQQHVVIGRTNAIVLFPQTVFRYAKILYSLPRNTFTWWLSFVEVGTFFFTAVLLWWAYVKKVPLSYILFGLLCFLVPTQSGTFSGLPRYALISFPIFIALSLSNKWVRIAYLLLAIPAQLILFAYFSRGYFVA